MSIIKVRTAQDLDNVRNNLSGHYVQVADIDLSGYANWNPIGGSNESDRFTGSYEGQGFKISNLKHESNGLYKGLFAYLASTSVVTGVLLRGVDIVANKWEREGIYSEEFPSEQYWGYYVGTLAGLIAGTVIDCSATGKVKGKTYVGSLGGYCSSLSDIQRCWTDVEVIGTGSQEVWMHYTKDTCWWESTPLGPIYTCGYRTGWWFEYNTYQHTGGFAGYHRGIVKDCYAKGPVSNIFNESHAGRVGGFIGEGRFQSVAENCYSTGLVTGHGAKGFMGAKDVDYVITSCYYDKETSGRPSDTLGIPTTTEDMKLKTTFVDWDFKNIWIIDLKINDGYPSFLNLVLDLLSGLKLPNFTFYFPLRFSLEPYLQNFRMFQMMYNRFVFDVNLQLNSDIRYGTKRYPPVYLKDHIGFVLGGDNDRAIMDAFNYNFRMLSSIRNLPLQMISDPKNMNDVCKRNFEMLNSKRRFL